MNRFESKSELDPGIKALPAWKVILKTIEFRPWLWFLNFLAMLFLIGSFMLPGLLIREFFTLLTDETAARFGLWALVFLLLMSEVGGVAGIFGLVLTNVPFFVHNLTLLRKNLLKHILSRPGAQALPDSPGEAISRFRGDVFEIPMFALWLNDINGMLLAGAAALVFMFSIHPKITLFAVAPFAVVAFISNAATKRIEYYRRESRKYSGIVTGFVAEMFGSVQAIKVATAEESVLEHFRVINDKRKKMAIRDRVFHEILHSIFRNSVNVGTGVVLIVASTEMAAGAFTVGDFAMFVFYLGFLSELTTFAGLLVARYKQIGISVERMYRLMQDAAPETLVEFSEVYQRGEYPPIEYPAKEPHHLIENLSVNELSYTYPDGKPGIENISFSVPRGSFTVVTGRVGSGKTTLLRVLLGLLPRDSGAIRWNARDIDDPARFFVPPVAAYTSQIPRLFSDTLRSNVLLGMDKADEEIMDAVRSSVLDRDVDELEHGLDTTVGPKGVKLSGGQMQRAATARMFVRDAELMVFDDLSSALDVNTERVLWDRFFAREGATCIAVSHRRAALARADQVIVLKDGRIDSVGPLNDLLDKSTEMKRLWHGDFDDDDEA